MTKSHRPAKNRSIFKTVVFFFLSFFFVLVTRRARDYHWPPELLWCPRGTYISSLRETPVNCSFTNGIKRIAQPYAVRVRVYFFSLFFANSRGSCPPTHLLTPPPRAARSVTTTHNIVSECAAAACDGVSSAVITRTPTTCGTGESPGRTIDAVDTTSSDLKSPYWRGGRGESVTSRTAERNKQRYRSAGNAERDGTACEITDRARVRYNWNNNLRQCKTAL